MPGQACRQDFAAGTGEKLVWPSEKNVWRPLLYTISTIVQH